MQNEWQLWSIAASLTVMTGLSSEYVNTRLSFGKPNIALPDDSSLSPYLPSQELAAPKTPPSFIAAARRKPVLQPFYLDWLGASGGMKEAPSKMHWPTIAQESTTLGWFKTSQIPIRVVVYLYSQVNSAGIPAEGSSYEYRCEQLVEQQATCTYRKMMHSEKPAIELILNDKADADACYVVVHAGWIVEQPQRTRNTNGDRATTDEVAASWAWNRCAMLKSHPFRI